MKYRKKPVVIEAIQFNGRNIDELHSFMGSVRGGNDGDGIYLEIVTLEGTMRANVNDFIIKGVSGEFYPCKPDIFEQTYERVEK